MPERLFVFIQMEFPWTLGPAEGRYLLREEMQGDAERVVVVGGLTAGLAAAMARASAGRLLLAGRRRGREAEVDPEPLPARVHTSRVTVIDPISLAAEQQALAWLEQFDREHEVLRATGIINRVLHAHRIAAADPHVREVSPGQALVIRAGWGEGEQVADGRWQHARELPWPPRSRRDSARRERAAVLRSQERLAALLGGRGRMLICEELVLRARLDLDLGRLSHAALELEDAYEVGIGELRGEARPDLAIRLAELEQLSDGVSEQAVVAREIGGEELDEEMLSHSLGRLEAALRARTASGV